MLGLTYNGLDKCDCKEAANEEEPYLNISLCLVQVMTDLTYDELDESDCPEAAEDDEDEDEADESLS